MIRPVISAALLLAASGTAVANPNTAVDSLIASAGLVSLDEREQEAARTLVRRLLTRNAASRTLDVSAAAYLRNEGFEPVHLQLVEVKGETYLIAKSTILSYATSDVPLLMNRYTFQPGEYFAKKSLMGGVSEFIDEDGDTQRLFLAKWFQLR